MNALLYTIVFLFCSFPLTAVEESRVVLKMATTPQARTIQDHLIDLYAEELFKSGLFEDLLSAKTAALNECLQENQDLHYYFLDSKNGASQYGYIVYSINDQIAFLELLYLNEAYRGQGLGIESLQLFEKILINKGILSIKLFVFAHNTAAFHLYIRMGYHVENSYFEDGKPIGYHMQKKLTHE